MVNVLVVLSGCGVSDGSEIHEAVSTLIHLDKHGAACTIAAPNKPQTRVFNHLAAEDAAGESRNILVESARIARGNIKSLIDINGADYDAVVFPGGFGAALNLCDFGLKGAQCTVDDEVKRVILEARQANKVLGFICIAPVLAAAVLGPDYQPQITIGNDAGTAAALVSLGAQHIDKGTTDICVDTVNKVVTTPAYMCAKSPGPVFDGIGKLITKVLEMV